MRPSTQYLYTFNFNKLMDVCWIRWLEGRLQLEAGGMQEVLETGDCAYIESEMTISLSTAGKHRCRVLAVTPTGA